MEQKENVNIVLIGQVHSGKSTLGGHLIYASGSIAPSVLENLERSSTEYGTPSKKYAWILDRLASERSGGSTIDRSIFRVETQHRTITMIDTPGHPSFVRNMITGASAADAALLVVSAVMTEFQEGVVEFGQTREHLLLAHTLGVRQLVVAVSKMDHGSVSYSEQHFKLVCSELEKHISRIGFDVAKVPMIPVSGFMGDNIINSSANTPWYRGVSLLSALDSLEPPVRYLDSALRIPVQDVYKIGGIGVVAIGRIASGILRPGQRLRFAPSNVEGTVRSIEMHHQVVPEGLSGDLVGFSVDGLSLKDIHRGFVACAVDQDPGRGVASFIARLVVLGHPGQIRNGYTPNIDCHTAHVPCEFRRLISRLDPATGEQLVNGGAIEGLVSGDCAIVELAPKIPIVVEAFHEYPPLGRFIVRDLLRTVAVGVVQSVVRLS